jgi:hypothetical protein
MTFTFTAKGRQFTVKNEFKKVASDLGINLEDIDFDNESQADIHYKLLDFCHNENGPAIVGLTSGKEIYMVNGEEISDAAQIEKMKNDGKFSEKLNNILEEK